MFTARFLSTVRGKAQLLARGLSGLPFTPNMVTVAGMLITFAAALLIGFQYPLLAGVVLILAGGCDVLDGALARVTRRTHPYGAFLDSTTDRCSEAATYIGIAAYFTFHFSLTWDIQLAILGCLIALSGSFLVSYVRARAQSLGFSCDSGLFARPERVVLTVGGLFLTHWLGERSLEVAVLLLAVFTLLTSIQRIYEVWQQARWRRSSRQPALPHASGSQRIR